MHFIDSVLITVYVDILITFYGLKMMISIVFTVNNV